jgi:hypothetical protein
VPNKMALFTRISLCTYEKVAEKGGPGAPFSAPCPPEPNPRVWPPLTIFWALVRQAPREPPLSLTLPTSPRPQRDLFWLHELCPQNALLSIYPAHHRSRYIQDCVTNHGLPSKSHTDFVILLHRASACAIFHQ